MRSDRLFVGKLFTIWLGLMTSTEARVDSAMCESHSEARDVATHLSFRQGEYVLPQVSKVLRSVRCHLCAHDAVCQRGYYRLLARFMMLVPPITCVDSRMMGGCVPEWGDVECSLTVVAISAIPPAFFCPWLWRDWGSTFLELGFRTFLVISALHMWWSVSLSPHCLWSTWVSTTGVSLVLSEESRRDHLQKTTTADDSVDHKILLLAVRWKS